MSAVKEKLDVTERTKFRKLESIVAEGISSFVAVGTALKEIRDAKLYREAYKTFEKYVDEKWGLERRRAYQLIEASDAKSNLCKILHKNEVAESINTESQLREIASVPTGQLEAVVNKASELAGDRPITASDLKQARVEILEHAEPESEPVYEDVDDDEPVAKPSKPKSDIPPEIQEALANGKYHQSLLNDINGLLRNLDAIPEAPGTSLLLSRRLSMRREIEGLKGKVLLSRPHAMCPRCKGVGCVQCGNYGWVSSAVYKELTK
jgi:hypothetical protein